MTANDNVQWDDEADVKAKQSAAIIASAEFRGRPDLIELAIASNEMIAGYHRETMALNKHRLSRSTETEAAYYQRLINQVMGRFTLESRRFDAILAAMDKPTEEEFWRRLLPEELGGRAG